MSDHGGKRDGAGRPPGSPNKINREIRALAGQHDEMAVRTLAEIASSGTSEASRVSAAVALLDRAHGKPAQQHEHGGDEDNPIVHRIERIIVRASTSDSNVGGV